MKLRLLVAAALVIVVGIIAFLVWPRGEEATVATTAPLPKTPATPHVEAAHEAPQAAVVKWTLDVDPIGPLRLEGQVIGPDGAGIRGAEVSLGSVPPRTTISEDDGTFSFDKLVGRTYALAAHKGELIGGPVAYKLATGSDPVVLRLAEGATIDVTVTDEAHEPIAGAVVKVRGLGEQKRESDAKGHAVIAPVAPGWMPVEVSAPGFAPGGGLATVGSAGARGLLTVMLKKGVSVSGRVTDEAGAGLAKVRVVWRGEDSDVTTDEKGQFTVPALPAGTHTITAIDGEHAPGHAQVKVSSTPVTGVSIIMTAGGVATGRVLDTGGRVVPYATVRIGGAGRAFGQLALRQTTSDAKGAFEIRGLSRAKLEARAESDLAASKLVPVDLTSQTTAKLEIVLDVTGTIAGTVVDELQQPVPEVVVNAWPDVLAGAPGEAAALAGFSSATTDGAGHFVIRGLPDAAYRLWPARPNGGFGWGTQSTPAKVGDTTVLVTLASPGTLKGTIAIDAAGAPRMATVQVGFQTPVPANNGAFEVKDLPPGKYDVTFHSLEFSELIRRNVEILPGRVTDLGVVKALHGRQIAGRVLDPSGTAVAGAKVRIGELLLGSDTDEGQDENDALANVRSAVTDGNGEFTIVGIPEKFGYIGAEQMDRGRSVPVAVAAGVGDPPNVTLSLLAFGTITGKVTKRGQPVGGAVVTESTKGAPGEATYATTHDDGTFAMTHVTEGAHGLTATTRVSMQSQTGSTQVSVKAGVTTIATIELPAGDLSLEVAIHPTGGAVVNAAQLFLFPGTFAATNGKELVDGSLQGVPASMKFWFGSDKPLPLFGELVAGPYTLCSIPITGDMNDQTFMQHIQENIPTLHVYCKPVVMLPQPVMQQFAQDLPAMTPLPPT